MTKLTLKKIAVGASATAILLTSAAIPAFAGNSGTGAEYHPQGSACGQYHGAFGWEMQDQGQDFGGYVVAVTGPQIPTSINDIGINGGIYGVSGKKQFNAFRCVIGVDDIDEAIKAVRDAGGKVEEHNMSPDGKDMGERMEIPGIGTWAKCEDTEGNSFSLLQPSLMMTKDEKN